MHQRQVIRTKIADLLVAGATDAGARVYPSRVLPLRRIELPALAVYTLEETVAAESVQTAPRELTRSLNVVIEGWVLRGSPDALVDDLMDDLAAQIETIMHADPYLGGEAGESILTGTETEIVEEGDRLMGLIMMTYQVTYRTFAPVVDADAMDDFLRASVEHNVTGVVYPTIDPTRPGTAHDIEEVPGP